MNGEWSELNKIMQTQIKKKDTCEAGIETLIKLRNELMQTLLSFKDCLPRDSFNAIPYINADGYHSKTIAYSIWHIFRIEDIVAHTLIKDDQQIFFSGGYQKRILSPIITTGNELVKQEIADFSRQLDIEQLFSYACEVKESTEKIIKSLSYGDMKLRVPQERREKLILLNVVSNNPNAYWLIDYWCNKDFRGLIQMPFSRHWIMHIEASQRIEKALKK